MWEFIQGMSNATSQGFHGKRFVEPHWDLRFMKGKNSKGVIW
jgi:hypothetical protein